MRVTLVTAGTRGDVQPMVAVGHALAARGHDVQLGVPPNLVAFVRQCGLVASPVGVDSQAFLRSPDGQKWLASGNAKAFLAALSKIQHESFHQHSQDLIAVAADAEVIVSGLLTEQLASSIAEAAGIPLVPLHSFPYRPTRGYAHGLVTTRQLPGSLDWLTAALVDRIRWRDARTDVNKMRSQLGLRPTASSTATRFRRAGTVEMQAYSHQLTPRIADYGTLRPFVGFPRLGPEGRRLLGEDGIDKSLAAWLDSGAPPIYFGFGSMPVSEPSRILATIAELCSRLGERALVSAGWSELGDGLGGPVAELAGDVFAARALDHDAVLPRCRAAVHHGGAGTTAASLSAGLPTFVCSVFADQPFWGARVVELGVGAHCRFPALDAAALERGLRSVLEPAVGERASLLGKLLRDEPDGAQQAAEIVERAGASKRP